MLPVLCLFFFFFFVLTGKEEKKSTTLHELTHSALVLLSGVSAKTVEKRYQVKWTDTNTRAGKEVNKKKNGMER